MKKPFPLFSAFVFTLCFTHTASAQVRFGIKGGGNLATVAFSDDYKNLLENLFGSEMKSSMVPAFHLGGQAEFDLGEQLGVGLGLQLSGKGYKFEFNYDLLDTVATYTQKSTPLYFQTPVYFYYRPNRFFVSAGAYVGFGIAGMYQLTTSVAGTEEINEGDIEFTNDYDPLADDNPELNYSSVDFGVGAELGYEFGKIRVTASYSYGLTNTFSKGYSEFVKENFEFEIKGSHRVIGLSVAYLFEAASEK